MHGLGCTKFCEIISGGIASLLFACLCLRPNSILLRVSFLDGYYAMNYSYRYFLSTFIMDSLCIRGIQCFIVGVEGPEPGLEPEFYSGFIMV